MENSKSDQLLSLFKETLREEIQKEEKEKSEKKLFTMLPMNGIDIFVSEPVAYFDLTKGACSRMEIVARINGKTFTDTLFIPTTSQSQFEMMKILNDFTKEFVSKLLWNEISAHFVEELFKNSRLFLK